MYKNDRVTIRYSEPFKFKILAELSTESSMGLRPQPLMNGLESMNVNTL